MYIYVYLNYFAEQQKLTLYTNCISTNFLKKRKKYVFAWHSRYFKKWQLPFITAKRYPSHRVKFFNFLIQPDLFCVRLGFAWPSVILHPFAMWMCSAVSHFSFSLRNYIPGQSLHGHLHLQEINLEWTPHPVSRERPPCGGGEGHLHCFAFVTEREPQTSDVRALGARKNPF